MEAEIYEQRDGGEKMRRGENGTRSQEVRCTKGTGYEGLMNGWRRVRRPEQPNRCKWARVK